MAAAVRSVLLSARPLWHCQALEVGLSQPSISEGKDTNTLLGCLLLCPSWCRIGAWLRAALLCHSRVIGLLCEEHRIGIPSVLEQMFGTLLDYITINSINQGHAKQREVIEALPWRT